MPDEMNDLVPVEQPTLAEIPDLDQLLPFPSIQPLSDAEMQRHQQFMTALVQIGKAAGGALVCPGNQVGVADSNKCPYAAKCELLRVQKAPAGELCPIEREFILARFIGLCQELGTDPKNLREDQRAFVDEMVWIEVQEVRCTSILSRGEAARLTQINVKDSNPETGEWISWERVIHSNSEMMDNLSMRKRMLNKEWMRSPEQKFKAAKALGKLGKGDDLGNRMSSRSEKLRDVQILDADYEDVPEK
jgi:hypothetical protein